MTDAQKAFGKMLSLQEVMDALVAMAYSSKARWDLLETVNCNAEDRLFLIEVMTRVECHRLKVAPYCFNHILAEAKRDVMIRVEKARQEVEQAIASEAA